LTSYAFTQHDGRRYAAQDLIDGKINAKITTKFLKSDNGDEWAVRVEGGAIDPSDFRRDWLKSV
jgi:mannosyl-oligosaccharide glucosidase